MIHENAGQTAADGPAQYRSGHGGIHAAAEGQKNTAIANLAADLFDGTGDNLFHLPIVGGLTNILQKAVQHSHSAFGVGGFGPELGAVKLTFRAAKGGDGAIVGGCGGHKAIGQSGDLGIHVHPADGHGRHILKKHRILA